MNATSVFRRLRLAPGWAREFGFAALGLLLGFGLLPLLIFLAGSLLLGRYDGASPARLYASLYRGFGSGSLASWIVLLGPYGLYLAFKALRLWWRASAGLG